MRRPEPRQRSEPTIALINIVFLMLVFFMVAGTLAPPLDPELTLVNTQNLEGQDPPNALVLRADGQITYRGLPLQDVSAFLAGLDEDKTARVVPDRNAPAAQLVALAQRLEDGGASRVVIVTERGLQ